MYRSRSPGGKPNHGFASVLSGMGIGATTVTVTAPLLFLISESNGVGCALSFLWALKLQLRA